MTGDLTHWQAIKARLDAGQPLRLLIGERFYDAAEIVLAPAFTGRLRATLAAEVEAHIADLTPPPTPAAPALPVERTA